MDILQQDTHIRRRYCTITTANLPETAVSVCLLPNKVPTRSQPPKPRWSLSKPATPGRNIRIFLFKLPKKKGKTHIRPNVFIIILLFLIIVNHPHLFRSLVSQYLQLCRVYSIDILLFNRYINSDFVFVVV